MLQVFNRNFSRSVVLLSSVLCAGNAFALPDRRHEAEVLNKSAYAALVKGSLFQTTSYLDPEGVEVEMAEESDYKLMDLDFALSYGITSSLEVTGFGRFRSVTSTSEGVEVSNNGPESLGIYAKYAFPLTGEIRYALGVHYSQTLYDNTLYANTAAVPADEIILGDSGSEYGIDILMTQK